jgi:hypothetical protein
MNIAFRFQVKPPQFPSQVLEKASFQLATLLKIILRTCVVSLPSWQRTLRIFPTNPRQRPLQVLVEIFYADPSLILKHRNQKFRDQWCF